MAIRIGDSCCLSLDMITPQARVVETRRFYNHPSQWYEIAKKCIAEKKFIIVTPCIAHIDFEGVPNETVWRGTIEDTVIKLLALGANKYNSRIDIINEPMKFVDIPTYVKLINTAYSQVNKRLPVGAGNEEFITAMAKGDMYNYICQNANFDVLVVHIQGSCDTPANTKKWCEWAYNLSQRYKKPIDCNEAFYADIATSKGWTLLQSQLYWAEKIGCPNFCNVFNNLDKKAFNHNTDKWNFLAFKINGMLRSNYWQQWKELMNEKAPVPNIPIIRSKDGMILPSVKLGTKGYLTELVEELLQYLGYEIETIDGNFTSADVTELKKFQDDIKNKYPNIVIDGICGRKCYFYLINEILDSSGKKDYQFKLEVYGSPAQ